MKPIRHLFWDFDGTLYDSYPNVTHAFLCTLDELGCPGLVTPREALSLLKVSVYSAAQHCAGMAGLDVSRVMEVFSRYHAQESGFAPYAGLSQCLRTLRDAGVRHYLYTHRDRRAIEQLGQDGLWSLFSDGVTSEDGFPHKPAPDALRCLLARNAIDPATAAMVGDRDIDIEAGHNAGMRGVLFDPDGFYPKVQAELYATSMAELTRLLLS
ncbi:MAG TPA: HAD-IA family hydrolase [Candidatus Limiplasma pullicola]|nr:HAD-IA family hydrolase [Candidatus Limiplasma pullicola]